MQFRLGRGNDDGGCDGGDGGGAGGSDKTEAERLRGCETEVPAERVLEPSMGDWFLVSPSVQTAEGT